ncbi:hypothetical protein F5890DRAFT_1478837 [Lentinula detonsa]|uniref:Uncharacterized protein n=1 Tax=Lentinula detonsa TaxID=2804962 RepID=A0AA38UM41_9AGAR|nr:hypothetical protein F5890DRAFT_1478837 [Lentinula detonsa]
MTNETTSDLRSWAASLVLDEASDDEGSPDEAEEHRKEMEDCVLLRPAGFVDAVENVAQQWLQNIFAKEKSSPNPDPSSQSSSVPSADFPQPVVDFLFETAVSEASSSSKLEARAWSLLDEYLNDSLNGDSVKVALNELHVGEAWTDMRIHIMQLEPDDPEAAQEIRDALESMKPKQDPMKLRQQQPKPDDLPPPEYESEEDEQVDVDIPTELQDLAEHLRHTLVPMFDVEDYGVYFVKCRRGQESAIVQRIQRDTRSGKTPYGIVGAFPSKLSGGVYIRSRTMLHSYVRGSTYLRTIPGFIYPRPPVISHPSGTVPAPVWDTPDLLMPVNRLVSAQSFHMPQKPFDWVVPSRGLYQGDVGCIVNAEDYQLAITTSEVSTLFQHLSKSLLLGNENFALSLNAYPNPQLRLHPLRLLLARIPLLYLRTCAHTAKVYTILNQMIAYEGFALVVLNRSQCQEAKTIPSKDLVHWLQASPSMIDGQLPLPDTMTMTVFATVMAMIFSTICLRTGRPIELRTGTPPPSTDWLHDPEVTKHLPRQQVLVALWGYSDDVEVEIRQGVQMIEAVHWIKPKNQAKRAQTISAQNLDPFLCSHAARKSFSNKLFLVCHGPHAGRLGRAVHYGVDDTVLLKPVRHECEERERARQLHFTEIAVAGPLIRAPTRSCAMVPMRADEDRAAKRDLNLMLLAYLVELHSRGYTFDADKGPCW